MIEPSELLRVVLGPVLVAAVVAAVGRWREWAWAMPLAAGAGFLAGYALVGVPRLPPTDGSDWLFWAAGPVTLIGVVAAALPPRRAWVGPVLGAAAAGAVPAVIGWPLVEAGSVTARDLVTVCAALVVVGAALCAAAQYAEPRIGANAVVAGLCVTLAAAAVVAMSSAFRILGVYGIAAAAALGTVAVLVGARAPRAGGAVAVFAVPVLTGLLTACRLYADLDPLHFAVLVGAPVLLMIGAVLPVGRPWVRGLVAVAVVAGAVGAVAVPTAIAAKRAAESTSADDPYADYYNQ